MADLSGVKVGDVLWYQPSDTRYKGHEITVTKVGRKYAYFEHNSRFSLDKGIHDCPGYSPLGRVYADRTIREAEAALASAWLSLRKDFDCRWKPPEGVTTEAIQQARALLGLDQA
jgi:hypothetical protein